MQYIYAAMYVWSESVRHNEHKDTKNFNLFGFSRVDQQVSHV
jgi:hypothetical protein